MSKIGDAIIADENIPKHWNNTAERCPVCGPLERNCDRCTEYFKKRKSERIKRNQPKGQS